MGWKYTKDGRLKLTQPHYDALKMVLCAQQDGICADCPSAINSEQAPLHHLDKRGMGGGKRSDWIGNDPALVEAAKEAAAMIEILGPKKLGWRKDRQIIAENILNAALTNAKVTTVTLLCPACHGKRHRDG